MYLVLLLNKGHLSNVATIFLASKVGLLERDYTVPAWSGSAAQLIILQS